MTAAIALSETYPAMPAASDVLARIVGVGKTYGVGENAVAALADATLDEVVESAVTHAEIGQRVGQFHRESEAFA